MMFSCGVQSSPSRSPSYSRDQQDHSKHRNDEFLQPLPGGGEASLLPSQCPPTPAPGLNPASSIIPLSGSESDLPLRAARDREESFGTEEFGAQPGRTAAVTHLKRGCGTEFSAALVV